MTETKIQFTAQADHPDFILKIYLDDVLVRTIEHNTQPEIIEILVDDDTECDHVLAVELLGKTWAHTEIDAAGKIVKDSLVHLSDFSIDDIAIDQLVWENARYLHDHNQTGEAAIHDYFGHMGCNGRVELEFSTPVYLWLLEKM